MCASVHLVRRLGEVECRDCGAVSGGVVADAGRVGDELALGLANSSPPGLAEEVEQALARVLGPVRTGRF